ncbi:MAG: phosphoribosylformylglycinamidine synthase subunit PurL [Chloroflexota bacterium]
MGHLQTYHIEVFSRTTNTNNQWVQTAHQLNIDSLTGCFDTRIFFVMGALSEQQLNRLASELLADPVTEEYIIGVSERDSATHTIDVTLQVGVTDPVAENLIRAANNLNLTITQAATGQRYHLSGDLADADLKKLAESVFSNTVVQHYTIDGAITAPFVSPKESDGLVETITLRDADDEQLLSISKERRLSLDLIEMKALQQWYVDEGREPTDIELEMVAQTWSEHCVHKTFKAKIHFEDENGKVEIVDGLIQQYLKAATDKVNKEWVYSAFVDNAGIVRFNDEFDLAFKAETHNHPSALEPFGGANTGVGGVVRDVLGVSAKPIANTDILCFGPQDLPDSELPDGVLHPRRIQAGVVHGIEDYGNKMGIPTVNGAIVYDKGYTANPLVFCGCVGILPHGSHVTDPQAGDYIVVLGGRTGRDGLRGATFSSMEMDTSTSEIASISVQIGHPINEKQVQEVILRARDEQLYNAITDCGAGGLSSAVGEMGETLGATVQLQTIPLKYAGLRPWEIWLSEAQERMVMAVAPENWERLKQIADGQDVEITNIGTFGNDGRIMLHYGDETVCDIGVDLLHECFPRRELYAKWEKPEITGKLNDSLISNKETLLKLLAHPNIRSKEDVVRRYDHEVQGGTVVKPFVGIEQHVGGDATVIVPIETKHNAGEEGESVQGFALSIGVCPQYTALDPYAMGWAAIDEAFRNLVAVGADPDQVSLLDNFSWGNPNLPDRLGSLVLASKACHDAAIAYNAPFISGKDSLNNEYADADGTRHAIPGTLVISAMGIVPDVTKTVTMDLKEAGNLLWVIGETHDEMGGSHFNMIHGIEGGTVPQPNENAINTMRVLYQAIQEDLIVSCHDVSEGGIAVALAEMCIAGGLGAEMITGPNSGADEHWTAEFLFSESSGRFIIEFERDSASKLNELFPTKLISLAGTVRDDKQVRIHKKDQGGALWFLRSHVDELEQAYRGHLKTENPAPSDDILTEPIERPTRISQPHSNPRVLILHANGTNRDHDAALACELAGGEPEIVHINQLLAGERNLLDYHMLVVPGGFSYGDDLGAGQLWAQDLRYKLRDDLERFALNGRPVLGICNGFQVLLKSGLLPNTDFASGEDRDVTLTYNENGHFECRWVYLKPNIHSTSLFTEGIDDLIYCPVAHGEGRVMTRNPRETQRLWTNGLVSLTYVDSDGNSVGYPQNPNGSVTGIAAINNYEGNVMGLMPHPEDHIFPWQHPNYHRGITGNFGLVLFENGIKHA